ncbi:MAG: hypothetical protein P1S46_02905 [bacterium]|nr:hypothetical protein [bacterium]
MPFGSGLLDIVHRRPAAVTAFLILLYAAMAWSQRSILDDAFISFRYAANLAQGHGLVWNTGEAPIEGFTNFLWVLIMTVPHLAGIDPVAFSMILGILAFAAALAVQFRLAAVVTGQPWAGTAAVLVLGGL